MNPKATTIEQSRKLLELGLDPTMIYIKRNQQEQQRMFNRNVNW